MMALGMALAVATMTEVRVAGNFRQSVAARYAAEAAVERAIADISILPNWNDALRGVVTSAFVDGPSSGRRRLPDGGTLDLTEATNVLRCGKSTCSADDLVARVDGRPWGPNNPLWQLYAYGPLGRMIPGLPESPVYVVVWVADDGAESDGDPLTDGGPPVGCRPERDPACLATNIGRGVIVLLARAYGPLGAQRTVEVTLGRTDHTGVRTVSWRAVQ